MNCQECKEKRADPVPFYVHEAAMARMSESAKKSMDNANRANRRWFIAFIIMCVLLAGCVASILLLNNARVDALHEKIEAINELRKLESELETVYEYEIEQNADNEGSNIVVGGDYYGEPKGQGYEDDTP